MTWMKRIATALMVAAALGLLTSTAWAQVLGSKHDFTTATGLAQGTTGATTEVCVFCHTPHGSNVGVSAPLWNKTVPTTTYQRYSSLGSATLDGTEEAVGSVSLACLSCHDGSQAMDIVINAPGPGGYDATGAQQIDGVAILAMTGVPIPNLEADLRNDHPISIEYAGGACRGSTTLCDPSLAGTGDPDFRVAQHATPNGGDAWWVDTGAANATREKTDMILYTRAFVAAGGAVGPSVECGSCHDPHEATARPVSFLRISNAGSAVCMACHIK